MLLNLHPVPARPRVEVARSGGLEVAGRLDEPGLIKRICAAEATLERAVAGGYFRTEAVTVFNFLYHFDSLDACLAYLAEDWTSAIVAERVIARARALLAAEGARLQIHERVQAARLARREREGARKSNGD